MAAVVMDDMEKTEDLLKACTRAVVKSFSDMPDIPQPGLPPNFLDFKQRKRRCMDGIWTDTDGHTYLLKDMAVSHIFNVLNKLKGKPKNKKPSDWSSNFDLNVRWIKQLNTELRKRDTQEAKEALTVLILLH